MSQKPKMQGTTTSSEPRRRTNIIVGLVILAIFILGGSGFLAWYGFIYSSPNRMLTDAISQLLSAERLTVKVDALSTSSEASDGYKSAFAAIGFRDHSRLQVTADASYTTLDAAGEEEDTIDVSLGLVRPSSNQFYLQATNITDAFDQYLGNSQLDLDNLPIADLPSYATIAALDGEWWEVSTAELLALGVPSELVSLVTTDPSDLLSAYQSSPFLQFDKASSTASINYDKLISFLGSLSYTTDARSLRALLPEDLTISLVIDAWTHQLQYIGLHRIHDDKGLFLGNIYLTYQAPTVSAPESYHPLSDLPALIQRANDNNWD